MGSSRTFRPETVPDLTRSSEIQKQRDKKKKPTADLHGGYIARTVQLGGARVAPQGRGTWQRVWLPYALLELLCPIIWPSLLFLFFFPSSFFPPLRPVHTTADKHAQVVQLELCPLYFRTMIARQDQPHHILLSRTLPDTSMNRFLDLN